MAGRKCTYFIKKNQWPANSSDLSFIETLWSYMNKKVHDKRARILEGLKKVIQNEWKNSARNDQKHLQFLPQKTATNC